LQTYEGISWVFLAKFIAMGVMLSWLSLTWIYNKLHTFSLDGNGLIPKNYIKQQECVLKNITQVMVIIMIQKVRESKNQFHASFESWGFML
jgi:hypothetical protein